MEVTASFLFNLVHVYGLQLPLHLLFLQVLNEFVYTVWSADSELFAIQDTQNPKLT